MATERIAAHIKFAYRVRNDSGGLVTSDIEQREIEESEEHSAAEHVLTSL